MWVLQMISSTMGRCDTWQPLHPCTDPVKPQPTQQKFCHCQALAGEISKTGMRKTHDDEAARRSKKFTTAAIITK